jgi:hypothetical protein
MVQSEVIKYTTCAGVRVACPDASSAILMFAKQAMEIPSLGAAAVPVAECAWDGITENSIADRSDIARNTREIDIVDNFKSNFRYPFSPLECEFSNYRFCA